MKTTPHLSPQVRAKEGGSLHAQPTPTHALSGIPDSGDSLGNQGPISQLGGGGGILLPLNSKSHV